MSDKTREVKDAAQVMKGYAKRLVGELTGRPDLVVKGEEDQTEALRDVREARAKDAE